MISTYFTLIMGSGALIFKIVSRDMTLTSYAFYLLQPPFMPECHFWCCISYLKTHCRYFQLMPRCQSMLLLTKIVLRFKLIKINEVKILRFKVSFKVFQTKLLLTVLGLPLVREKVTHRESEKPLCERPLCARLDLPNILVLIWVNKS